MAEAGGCQRLWNCRDSRFNGLLARSVRARAALSDPTLDKGPRQLNRVQVIEDDRAGE